MAVAARTIHAKRRSSARRVTVRAVKPKRRLLGRARRHILPLVIVSALGLMFGYVNLYANLAATNVNRTELQERYRLEKIKHERLKLELDRRSSPQNISVAAQDLDMVYATDYDYLELPSKVASAHKGR